MQTQWVPEARQLARLGEKRELSRADVPLPGGAEAVYEAGGLTAFRHADQLGSAPLASTTNNTVWSAVGYAPYGEPFSSTGSDRSLALRCFLTRRLRRASPLWRSVLLRLHWFSRGRRRSC